MKPTDYYYKHDPEAPSVVNASRSMEMDGLRAKMAPTTESARAKVLAAEQARESGSRSLYTTENGDNPTGGRG